MLNVKFMYIEAVLVCFAAFKKKTVLKFLESHQGRKKAEAVGPEGPMC